VWYVTLAEAVERHRAVTENHGRHGGFTKRQRYVLASEQQIDNILGLLTKAQDFIFGQQTASLH
jgi:hypothetical protein